MQSWSPLTVSLTSRSQALSEATLWLHFDNLRSTALAKFWGKKPFSLQWKGEKTSIDSVRDCAQTSDFRCVYAVTTVSAMHWRLCACSLYCLSGWTTRGCTCRRLLLIFEHHRVEGKKKKKPMALKSNTRDLSPFVGCMGLSQAMQLHLCQLLRGFLRVLMEIDLLKAHDFAVVLHHPHHLLSG